MMISSPIIHSQRSTHHWEHIEGDLTTNAVLEVEIVKSLLQHAHHCLSNVVNSVVRFECITLFLRAITTNGADVEHTRAEFDESATAQVNL